MAEVALFDGKKWSETFDTGYFGHDGFLILTNKSCHKITEPSFGKRYCEWENEYVGRRNKKRGKSVR